jgi:hypothetical protein
MLDSLVITDVGFNITPSNATNLYAINGMLNPLANAIVKGLEQTTVVSVYNIRSHAAVTNNYVPTNGITGDFLGAAVQAGNIALNKYVLGPIGDLFGVNARVALTGESKQVRDFFEDIVAERGQEGGLIALHSRANQETMLALQSVDEGFFPKNPITGESHYLFMSNGSPVNGSVLSSAIHNAAGALIALVCKSTDQICQGVGGNTGTYIAQRQWRQLFAGADILAGVVS